MFIEIINDAVCNVTFGIGGPFNICMAFSTKHIAVVPFYKLSNYVGILEEINQLNHCIIENVEEIGSRIESACEII